MKDSPEEGRIMSYYEQTGRQATRREMKRGERGERVNSQQKTHLFSVTALRGIFFFFET